MCRPAGVGSAGLRPAAGSGVMPLGTVRSLRLTAVSTSRSAPLSYDARAPLSSHGGVGVPRCRSAGPGPGNAGVVNELPAWGRIGGHFALCILGGTVGTRSLPPYSDRRLRVAWTARGTAPGPSVVGVPTKAWGSPSERAAKEPHPRGAALWPLRSGHGFAER